MPRRHLSAMYAAFLCLGLVSNGIGGLWPVYLAHLGANPAFVGYFSGAALLAMAAGAVLAGWLADRFQRRKLLFLLAGATWTACWLAMAASRSLLALTLLNALAGFAYGIAFNLIGILCGLLAGSDQRGKVFGILALVLGASVVLAGMTAGPVADRWGFPALLLLAAGAGALCVLAGVFFRDVKVERTPPTADQGRAPAALGRDFWLLIFSALFAALGMYASGLGRPVTMNTLGFSATAISLTMAIGGLVGLPVPPAAGWLSDRAGRKLLLVLCTGAGLAGLIVQAYAGSQYAFWLGAALMGVFSAAPPVAQAWIADLVPPRSLGLALSLLGGVGSLSGFLGASLMGLAIQELGQRLAFLSVGVLLFAGMLLMLAVRERAAGRSVVIAHR